MALLNEVVGLAEYLKQFAADRSTEAASLVLVRPSNLPRRYVHSSCLCVVNLKYFIESQFTTLEPGGGLHHRVSFMNKNIES